jgi:hypothetical protein
MSDFAVFVKVQACPGSLRWYLVASVAVYAIVAVVGAVDWVLLTRHNVHRGDRSLRRTLLNNFGLLFAAALFRCGYLLVGVLWRQLPAAAYFAVFCLSQLCMFWLFSAVLLGWALINHRPLESVDQDVQFKSLVVVNTLLVAVVSALAVLVNVASSKADRDRYIWAANITVGLFSFVLGVLLLFYGRKVGALRPKTKPGTGHSSPSNSTRLHSVLLGVLFCGQAACWAVSDPEGDHLAAVVVVSHSLSSAALVLLLTIFRRNAAKLRGKTEGRGSSWVSHAPLSSHTRITWTRPSAGSCPPSRALASETVTGTVSMAAWATTGPAVAVPSLPETAP